MYHETAAYVLHDTAGKHIGGGKPRQKEVRDPSSLQVPYQQAPDHPEGKAVHEHGQDLPARRENRHCAEAQLRKKNEPHQGLGPPLGAKGGANSDPQEFGNRVAEDLAHQQGGLELNDGPREILSSELRHRNGLTEGVHAEVGPEGCQQKKGSASAGPGSTSWAPAPRAGSARRLHGGIRHAGAADPQPPEGLPLSRRG